MDEALQLITIMFSFFFFLFLIWNSVEIPLCFCSFGKYTMLFRLISCWFVLCSNFRFFLLLLILLWVCSKYMWTRGHMACSLRYSSSIRQQFNASIHRCAFADEGKSVCVYYVCDIKKFFVFFLFWFSIKCIHWLLQFWPFSISEYKFYHSVKHRTVCYFGEIFFFCVSWSRP